MSAYRTCDGVTRRDFLTVGTLGVLGLTLPEFLHMQQVAAAEKEGKAKACIVLWLGGGPSHVDTWDPKPEAPVECRGEFKAISAKGADFQICEHLPKMAMNADKYSLIRSLTHP